MHWRTALRQASPRHRTGRVAYACALGCTFLALLWLGLAGGVLWLTIIASVRWMELRLKGDGGRGRPSNARSSTIRFFEGDGV